ncbi:hypothetical protein ABPG72_016990 [Tetrahymena utriculariae]
MKAQFIDSVNLILKNFMFNQQQSVCQIKFIPDKSEKYFNEKTGEPNFTKVEFKQIRNFQEKAKEFIQTVEVSDKIDFMEDQIKITLIGEDIMKNLRENQIINTQYKNQNIDFLVNFKSKFTQKNIQFLTSEEALQISLRIKPKQIQQKSKYSGTFQIRNELTADVVVFTKTLEKHLLNLKPYSNITEWSPDPLKQMVDQEVQYFQVDDFLLNNCVKEISKCYNYGDKLVKMSELFSNQINLFTLKEIKLIGSVQKSSIPRQSFMSGCDVLFAKQDSKRSRYIIASLIKACFEEQRYLVARFVLRQNSIPKLIALIPRVKKNCEYFYILELPTVESIRDYAFNSLISSTPDQQKLMSQLIDELDLDQYEENQNLFKIGSQPNETIAKMNEIILMRGLNMNEEEINKIILTKEYQQKFKPASQILLSNINKHFNLKMINQQFYHDNFNQKVYWKNLITQKDDKLLNDFDEFINLIEKQKGRDSMQKAYKQIDFSMPQQDIICVLSQPLIDINEFYEYAEIVQNLIYKTMNTFIKGYTSKIIIELILLIRNKSLQFEQYEVINLSIYLKNNKFNQFLIQFYEKFQNDQFVNEIVSKEINLISKENHQSSIILTQIEEEFLRQNILQKEMQKFKISSQDQDLKNLDKTLTINTNVQNIQNNEEEIYYSDESETNQSRKHHQNYNELEQNQLNLNDQKQTQQSKKLNKQLVSFTQQSSYNSIYSESENSKDEDQILQINQDLNSSIDEQREEEEEEQKYEFYKNKGAFYKKLNLNDVNFKLCTDNQVLKETLINIDLTYRKPLVKNIPLESTPLYIFQKFWSDEIWKLITDETNKYSKQCFDIDQFRLDNQSQKKQKLCFFSQNQIKRFIICEILMGIQRLPSFSDYFSSNPLLSGGLNRILGRENYQLLTRYLHLSDNQNKMVHVDDHAKFKQFQSILNRNYQQFYIPSNYLAIDEGIIPFKGKTKFKVYCPQKPVKFGIKEYLFCDYSGYTLNQIINSPHEKQNIKDIYQPQTLQTQNIVKDLIKDYQPLSGSILIMDNYYNSLNLIHDLNQQNIGVLGTVRPDRMNFTQEQKKMMKIQNFNKGETKSLTKDNIHILLWRDKDKLVKMITNFLDNRKIVKSMKKTGQIKTIPLMVDIYNKYAHSVDKRNQICQNYRIHKRSQKWWKCVFYRLLDTTLCNAYIIYKILNEGKKSLLTHKDFRIKIVEELIQSLNESTAQLTKSISHSRGIIYSLIDINKVRKQGVQQEIIAHFLEKQNQARLCSLCKQTTFFTCESCNYGNKKVALCPVNCHKEHMKKVYNLTDM